MPTIRSSKQAPKTHFNALIHSFTKAGKTLSAAATSPRPLVILTESEGSESLTEANIRKVFNNGEGLENLNVEIPIIDAFTWDDFTAAVDYALTPEIMETYDTLIIDSISEASVLALKHFMALNKDG